MIPNGTRFIGISPEVDLKERKSAMLNKQTEPYTIDDIKGYKVFTALLTQSGGDDAIGITSGDIVIGVTYFINDDFGGADFTNVGAPNNNTGTYFIATGTTPKSWGVSGNLIYNPGAPVAIVLENTIGNIWFTYGDVGYYGINSNALFIDNKTFMLFGPYVDPEARIIYSSNQINSNIINIGNTYTEGIIDGVLNNTPIEIRVYN